MKYILFILLLTLHFCLDAQSADDDFELIQTEIQTNQGPKKVYQLNHPNRPWYVFSQYLYSKRKNAYQLLVNDNYDQDYSLVWQKVRIKKLDNGPFTILTGGKLYCSSSIIIFDKEGKDVLNPKHPNHESCLTLFKKIGSKKDISKGPKFRDFLDGFRSKQNENPEFVDIYKSKLKSPPEYSPLTIALKDTTLTLRKLTMYDLRGQLWAQKWMKQQFGDSEYSIDINPCILEEYDVWTNIKLPFYSQDSFTIMAGGERDGWTSIAIVDSKYKDVFAPGHPLRYKLASFFIQEFQKLKVDSKPFFSIPNLAYNTISIRKNIIVETIIEPHHFLIAGDSVDLHRFRIASGVDEMTRFFSRYFKKHEQEWQDYSYIADKEEGFYTWRDIQLPGFEEKFTIITGGKLFCEASMAIVDSDGQDVLDASHRFFQKMNAFIKDVLLQDKLKNTFPFYGNEGNMLREKIEESELDIENSEHGFIKTIFPINESGIPGTPIHRLTFFEIQSAVYAGYFMILHSGKWDGYYKDETCREFAIWKDVQFHDISQKKFTVITTGELDAWPSIILLDQNNNDVFAEDASDRDKWAAYFHTAFLKVNPNKAGPLWKWHYR